MAARIDIINKELSKNPSTVDEILNSIENNNLIRCDNFINGEFVPPLADNYFKNVKPATNEIYSEFPDSSSEDVDNAVQAAKSAQQNWAETSIMERANFLNLIGDALRELQREIATVEMHDCGKTFGFAFHVDINRASQNFKFFAQQLLIDGSECFQGMAGLNYSTREPLGVCGLITPWNLPLYLLTWKVAPALACGNTVVCKPSEVTPMTAYILGLICQKVGLPNGVVNIVHGFGQNVGQPLCEHTDVAAISFTGGTATGRIVGAQAGRHLKKVSLELGGKNPGIIFADCDLDKCINDLRRACFANQGQVCLTMERLFVQEEILDELLEKWIADLNSYLSFGDNSKSNFGSLVSSQHLEKVESYIQLAQEEGGTIVFGGCKPELEEPWCNGNVIMPTIITGLAHTSRCATEEVFGPFVTIHPFSTEEELLEMTNHVNYGLACSLWTNDLNRAHRISKRVKIGMVWVNGWCIRDLRAPFGGTGISGIGREGGVHSLEFYSEMKNVCLNIQY